MRSILFLSFGISYILTIVYCQGSEQTWKKKEKSLSMLEMAKESITKANDLLTVIDHCDKTPNESSSCEDVKKTLFYLEVATTLISTVKENFQRERSKIVHEKPMDCTQVMENGNTVSGIYSIWPGVRIRPIDAYCDMDTDGGGWTVVQRRGNFAPQEDFDRDWDDYKFGFGNKTRDFWLGNDNLFVLSNQRKYKIRFDLESMEGEKAYALYESFNIQDEKANYKLHITRYNGNAGDSMEYHNGEFFTTRDRDNDKSPGKCTEGESGGWWFKWCTNCNLNREYNSGRTGCGNIYWHKWKGCGALASTEIKMKALQN